MSIDQNLTQVKKKIKDWEHDFVKVHSRPPSKTDVKEDAHISKLYKLYRALKLKQQKLPDKPQQIPPKPATDVDIDNLKGLSDDEKELDGPQEVSAFYNNSELGPTPQAGGKVLSIFDIRMTPPEPSPSKRKVPLVPHNGPSEDLEFKTPTKPKLITQVTPLRSASKSSSFMHRIAMASSSSPTKTPMRTPVSMGLGALAADTPQYLKRNISKFELSQTDKSPFLSQPSSPVNTRSPSTPTSKSTINFSVSPSPLKSHGFRQMGNRSLLDVYRDHKSIIISQQEHDKYGVDSESSEEEQALTGESYVPRRKKSKTQKRSTRRYKIKPNIASVEDDSMGSKNLHKVLEEINENEEKRLEKMAQGVESSEGEESEEDKKPVKPATKSKGRKVAPISHNYKRLKIHYKKNKNWGRRR